MTNILCGGAHAGGAMDFQDFLAVPVGARTFAEAIAMLARVRSAAADELAAEGPLDPACRRGRPQPRLPHRR